MASSNFRADAGVFVFFVLQWGMAAPLMHTVLPASDDEDDAAAVRDLLAGPGRIALSTPNGEITLPEHLRRILADAAAALADGQAVTVEPHRTVLTTSEAAELLGISRPTFVRLLESGKIPYTSPGRHRRVELADVLAFQQRERTRRRQVLDEMASEATPDPSSATDGFTSTR